MQAKEKIQVLAAKSTEADEETLMFLMESGCIEARIEAIKNPLRSKAVLEAGANDKKAEVRSAAISILLAKF